MTRESIDQLFDELQKALAHDAPLGVLAERTFDLYKAVLAAMGAAEPPVHWKLSPVETKIARAFALHQSRTTVQLIKEVYGKDAQPTGREAQNIYVFVHRLRKKLWKFGIKIDRNGHGRFSDPKARGGYFVTDFSLPLLRKGLGFYD
jgi:hypothetical protein